MTSESAASSPVTGVFWSGHSLTDPPIPQMLAGISAGFGKPMRWNRHSMAGASLEARTRGRPPQPDGWAGYRQGYNRDTQNMDVITELQTAESIGGGRYDVLVITEVHDFLWSLLRTDTIRLLRHYHERFIAANAVGQTFFYQSWLGVNDPQNPQAWMDYERAAAPVWQCMATRINTSLAAEKRRDRLRFLPAGLALAELVDQATTEPGISGITANTASATMARIFRDDVHLSDQGAYYIALVSYAFIFDASPIDAWAPSNINPEVSHALQRLAQAFYTNYQSGNRPLSLAECRERVRNSFAARYWRYLDAGQRHDDLPWYTAAYRRISDLVRRERNIRRWQQGFAEDAADNPFRFDPDSDAGYWHLPP